MLLAKSTGKFVYEGNDTAILDNGMHSLKRALLSLEESLTPVLLDVSNILTLLSLQYPLQNPESYNPMRHPPIQ